MLPQKRTIKIADQLVVRLELVSWIVVIELSVEELGAIIEEPTRFWYVVLVFESLCLLRKVLVV